MLAMTMLAMIKILQSKNRDNPKSEMDLVLQGLQLESDAITAFGAGVQLRLPEMVPPTVMHLLNHSEQLEFMRDRARLLGQPRAALEIAERIVTEWRSQMSPAISQVQNV